MRQGSSFILLYLYLVVPALFVEEFYFFPHWVVLASLSKSIDHRSSCCGTTGSAASWEALECRFDPRVSGLKIWCCCSCGVCYSSGSGLTSGLGTAKCHRGSQKRKENPKFVTFYHMFYFMFKLILICERCHPAIYMSDSIF